PSPPVQVAMDAAQHDDKRHPLRPGRKGTGTRDRRPRLRGSQRAEPATAAADGRERQSATRTSYPASAKATRSASAAPASVSTTGNSSDPPTWAKVARPSFDASA